MPSFLSCAGGGGVLGLEPGGDRLLPLGIREPLEELLEDGTLVGVAPGPSVCVVPIVAALAFVFFF